MAWENEHYIAKANALEHELVEAVRELIGCYQYVGNDSVRVHGPQFRACQDIIAERDAALAQVRVDKQE